MLQLDLTPVAAFLLAVVAQALFAAGLLAAAPLNRRPNRLLALLMAAIALWLLDGLGRAGGLYGRYPELYFSPIYYSLGFGPLLYFYVRSLTNAGWRWRGRYGWHFAPVAVQAALYGWLRLQPYAVRGHFWEHIHRPFTYRLEFIGTWVSLLVYLLLSLRLLRQYERWLPENFSEVSQLRLRWLRALLLLLALVSGQWFVEIVLREFFGLYYRYDFSTELLGVVVFVIGVVGLRQADMQAVAFEPADAAAPAAPEASPAAALSAALPAAPPPPAAPDPALLARIGAALADDGLYLNPTLTLAELAAHLRLPPKAVSAAINAGFGRTFNDLVNGYRVAEVQRRLAAPDARRFTLLGIAFESGFNSKTTFNRIFKQTTGVAPRAFGG